jgi:hypothetical protein
MVRRSGFARACGRSHWMVTLSDTPARETSIVSSSRPSLRRQGAVCEAFLYYICQSSLLKSFALLVYRRKNSSAKEVVRSRAPYDAGNRCWDRRCESSEDRFICCTCIDSESLGMCNLHFLGVSPVTDIRLSRGLP